MHAYFGVFNVLQTALVSDVVGVAFYIFLSAWMCPVLPAIEGAGEPSCTKEQSFRSICTYKCSKPGYDMPSGVGSTYVCSVHKNWEHTGNPKCIGKYPLPMARDVLDTIQNSMDLVVSFGVV